MKNLKTFEDFISEAVKSKRPNEVETVDVDLAGDDKDIMAAIKKFNLTAVSNGHNRGMGFDLTGKKKDIIAYLQSEYYDMDDDDIKDLYPELLEGNELDEAMVQVAGKSKPAGAVVLAKVILDFLEDGKHLTPAAERQLIGLQEDIANLIMSSTF